MQVEVEISYKFQKSSERDRKENQLKQILRVHTFFIRLFGFTMFTANYMLHVSDYRNFWYTER